MSWKASPSCARMRLLESARPSMPNGVPMAWMATLTSIRLVVDRGRGASFTDIDGNFYLDFNLADTRMFSGHGVEAVARVAGERVAAGSQLTSTRWTRAGPRGCCGYLEVLDGFLGEVTRSSENSLSA